MLVCIKGQNIVADYYFAIDHLRSSYYNEMSVYLCIGSEVQLVSSLGNKVIC